MKERERKTEWAEEKWEGKNGTGMMQQVYVLIHSHAVSRSHTHLAVQEN